MEADKLPHRSALRHGGARSRLPLAPNTTGATRTIASVQPGARRLLAVILVTHLRNIDTRAVTLWRVKLGQVTTGGDGANASDWQR